MSVKERLQHLKNLAPGDANGARKTEKQDAPVQGPKQALTILLPMLGLLAIVTLQRGRHHGVVPVSRLGKIGEQVKARRSKPRKMLRYYGISLLIGALERDITRKAVIAGLKLARARA
jgi:hypothetical protein